MFWEIAGLILQAVQLGLYLSALDQYRGKLEDLAQWLCDSADLNRDIYLSLRDSDPDFYEYYKTLPEYQLCQSAVERGKGDAFRQYGRRLRRSLRTNRGYTPLNKVHLNNVFAADALMQTAHHRATTEIKERSRVDSHVLERWSAIVGAPVGVEKYYPGATNNIIQQSFQNLRSLGQGFNSAGAAFGTQLYRILD